MVAAQPKATVLGNGALLLTAGRPGIDLWGRYASNAHHNLISGDVSERLLLCGPVSADGFGRR